MDVASFYAFTYTSHVFCLFKAIKMQYLAIIILQVQSEIVETRSYGGKVNALSILPLWKLLLRIFGDDC